jgi:NitT/TauT family transport system substrate-binding protein
MQLLQNRRDFLASASMAAAAGILGARGSVADDGPPEVTTIRLSRDPSICLAPGYIADDLLRAEGFTDVRYVPRTRVNPVADGEVDFLFESAPWIVSQLAAGQPMTALAGIHSGCYELFAHEPVRTISDLKGRKVGIVGDLLSDETAPRYTSGGYMLLAVMAAYVGLDPHRDIDWITPGPSGTPKQLFVEREVDAFLAAPPEPQELRARKIGQVILNEATDQPWSQYFCCLTSGNREFVRRHPIATKRYLRAVLKAADLCAADPARAARRLVDAGFTNQYDYALQTFTEVPYDVWREFDPEDSLRFYALRLHEVGMIKSTPHKILAEGTDWRFVNELKQELKT